MKKAKSVSNSSTSAGNIGKASVQKNQASGDSHIPLAVKSKQQYTSNQPFENQDRYSELFNLVGSGVAVYKAVDKGKDFIFTDFNRAAEKIERISRKKVIGRRVTEVFPGIREMSLLKTFQSVWRTGKPEYHPAAIYKDESLKSWRENYVYKLPSGEIMAIYEDITERKQVEERIADEVTRRRILIDQSRDGIVILDTDGRVYETNKRFAEMLGYTQKEVLSLHVWDWDFKLPKKQIVKMIRDIDETGDHFETQHKRKDGSIFDVAISTNGSLFAGQKLIFCVCHDITESKRTEMKLRESEERFRSLYENATIGMYRTTPNGKVLMANQALVKMLGFKSVDEMTKRNLNREGFETSSSRKEFQQQIEEKGVVHGYESSWKTVTGSTIFVRESAIALRDKSGKVLYYEGTVEDISERRIAEMAQSELQTKIAFQATLLDQVRNAVIATDLDGRIVYMNKFAEILYQWPALEAMGKTVIEVTVPDINQQAAEDIMLSVQKNGYWEGEFNVRRKGGEVFPAFVVDVVVKDKKDKPIGLVGISMDISDLKRTEKTLRESEERFRSLYENATIGMYRTTPGGKILLANQVLVKLLGYDSLDEITRRNLNQEGFEDKKSRREFQRQIEAQGTVHGYESKWKTKNGSIVNVREGARVVRDKNGKVLYYEGTVEDISERHQAERALKDNEIFLNSVIDNIPDMIFVKDVPDLRFVRLNKAGEELLGISSQLMLGKNDYDFFLPEEAQHFISKDKETLKKRLLLDIPEEKIQTKNQGERILHTKKIPILDAAGNPKYLLGISEDITERKQAERSLLILSDTQRQLAQVDTLEELYQLVGKKLLEMAPESYIVFSVLDEAQQVTRPAGLFGFGPVYEKLKKAYKIDPAKYVYPQKDMTPEEVRLFRSGRLEEFPGGIYALMVRKIPKSICMAGEKQLKIKKIYTQGLVYQGNYLGVIAILARGDISPFKEMIEIIIQQASITFSRIKSRKALEESEERFRGLFEDSPVSLWLEDFSSAKKRVEVLRARGVKDMRAYLEAHPEEVSDCAALTRIIDVNKAGVNLFKAETKADLLKNLSKILSAESLNEFRQELVYLAEGKTKFTWEGKSLTLAGELIDTNLSWSVVPGHESDLSRVLVSIEDISERKKSVASLQESEERFRGLFEDSPVSLWEEDFSAVKQRLDTLKAKVAAGLYDFLVSHPEEVVKCASLIKVLDVNNAALKLYGARDKEHLIDNLAQIVSIEPSGKFVEELVNISNGLTRFNYETVNQAIGGRKINISISWTAAPGHEKDLSRVLVSIVDITERKQAEAKMDHLITELRDLSETEKKNRIFAETLAKNISVINSSLKAEEVMDSIIESISAIVPYDAASVMMVKGQQARIVRSKGYREKGLEKWVEQAQFDLNKIKDFNSIIRNKKYKVTSNTETSKDWTVVAETAWVKSHITSPLIENGQVIGFLNLDSATPGFYSEDHAKVLMSFSEQVSTALKNARQFEETRRRMDRMQAMTQIDLAINSSLDINVSLEIVLIQAKDKLNADAVDILQVNNGTNSLVFSKAKGFMTDEIRKTNFRLGTGLPGRAVLERTLIAIPDLRSAPESYFRNLLVEREGFASYYCAPLITKGELKGVMEIYFREPYKADQEWREFLEMLAQQTAIAINNAELLNSLKVSNADLINAYETTLKGWVDALDMRDHETEGHTRRVTELSLQLALRMGIKDSEIVNFERGALLHDIGKVGIADNILNKPGPLTEEEWVIMRKHPLYAFQLLSKSKYLIPALDIPYSHHEKWDGSGYPRGLKGEAIPFAARIFAIIDVWDALISDRPYRKAWTQKQALDHIQEQSGKHFDPKVVLAFNSLPKTEIKK